MTSQPVHGRPGKGATASIVIVADDYQFLDTVRSTSHGAVYEWLLASTRRQLLDFLHPPPFAFVVDLQMHGLDPIETLQLLGSQPNPSRVVLLTGGDLRMLASARSLGGELSLDILGMLTRPLGLNALMELLKQHVNTTDRIELTGLQAAIDDRQFTLHYQPVLSLQAGDWGVREAEALVRWAHPSRGLLYPGQFLRIAATSGLMEQLSWYVVAEAAGQVGEWERQGIELGVSVNLTPAFMCETGFVERLLGLLQTARVSPGQFTIELVDAALARDWKALFEVCTRLRLQGVGLSLDDFGTRHASMLELYRLPFSEVKIDRILIGDAAQSHAAEIVIGSLVELAHKLSIRVCAEAVETPETAALMVKMGCDALQGIAIARPVSADQMAETLESVASAWPAISL
jgi:EAL domain-containing protein (putative c-di-GMP-specific phosphodiesterase class I)